jgi:hypothetical protein
MARNSSIKPLSRELIAAANVQVWPGDVFYVRSKTPLGRIIRFFSRRPFEAPTKTNHTGMFAEYGRIRDVKCIEASHVTKHHSFWDNYYGKDCWITVYRCKDLPYNTRLMLVEEAMSFVGHVYGYWKLLLHLGDWFLMGANVFRRLAILDAFPICSLEVAHPYAKILGYRFGLSPKSAQPDDMLDWTEAHPNKWDCLLEWTKF